MQEHNTAILSQAEMKISGVCRDLTGIISQGDEGKVQPLLKNWDKLTSGDIILADFGEYILIDKGGISNASSIHVSFLTDQTVFRFVYRVDGQPSWNAALTPYKSAGATGTLSPFVVLS